MIIIMPKRYVYFVYDKNETVLCSGSSQECADYLNIDLTCFYSIHSRMRRGIQKKTHGNFTIEAINEKELYE